MGILLSLIAPFLYLILSPLNLLVIIIKNYKVHGFLKVINRYSLDSAINVDKFGNYNLSALLNATLIKGYRFGNKDETISGVIGKNQRDGTLTIVGKILAFVLDTIEKNHCKNSINDNI